MFEFCSSWCRHNLKVGTQLRADLSRILSSHSRCAGPSVASAGPLAPAGLQAPHPTPPSLSFHPLLSFPFLYLHSPPVTSLPYLSFPYLPLEVGPLKSS